VSNNGEVELKVKKAKADLVRMCFDFVRSYYVKTKRPKMTRTLDAVAKLHARFTAGRELLAEDGGSMEGSNDATVHKQEKEEKRGVDVDGSINDVLAGDSLSPSWDSRSPLLSGKHRGGTSSLLSSSSTAVLGEENPIYDSEHLRLASDRSFKDQATQLWYGVRQRCTLDNAFELLLTKLPILYWFPLLYLPWAFSSAEGGKRGGLAEAVDEGEEKDKQKKRGAWQALENLRCDLVAAITVGFMLVPQVLSCSNRTHSIAIVTAIILRKGMSYALVAELPPIYGLYSALVPLVIYTVRSNIIWPG